MVEYKTLEQQIQELWKSRGLEVQTIQFKAISVDKKIYEWIIHAKRKE
ncbi:unnamed protein product [marine sediment metagenome]|uniref:Uncharacterized protein n=1 Tax=marine sediment metagenome TaxID=412755 RepID=X1IW22_9ZZZZ